MNSRPDAEMIARLAGLLPPALLEWADARTTGPGRSSTDAELGAN